MIKTYIETIGEETVNFLEALSYEVESRKNLLDFLSEKPDVNEKLFDKYFSEYQEFFVKYDLAKKNFEFTYIREKYPQVINWELTFYNRELKINVQED